MPAPHAGLGVALSDTQPQREPVVQSCVREIKIATAIQPVHQRLVRLVSAYMTEADQVQRHRRGQLETLVLPDPGRKILRQRHVPPDMMLQTFDAVVPDARTIA